MKVTYNSGRNTLRILLCNAPIQASETHPAGIILDYDHTGRIVGLEITSVSKHLSPPIQVDFTETNDGAQEGGSEESCPTISPVFLRSERFLRR